MQWLAAQHLAIPITTGHSVRSANCSGISVKRYFCASEALSILMRREIALKFNIDPTPPLSLTMTCIGVGLDETLLCPSWETGERQQHRRHGRTALPVCLPPPSTNAGLARQERRRETSGAERKRWKMELVRGERVCESSEQSRRKRGRNKCVVGRIPKKAAYRGRRSPPSVPFAHAPAAPQ